MTKPAISTTVQYVNGSTIRAAIVTGAGGSSTDDSISCRVIVPHGTDFDADSVPTLAEGSDHAPYWQFPGFSF